MWLSVWGLLQKMVLVCNCKRDQGIQAQLRSIGEAQRGVEPAWISCISWLGIVIDLIWFYDVLWWFMTIRTLTPEKQRKSMSTSGWLTFHQRPRLIMHRGEAAGFQPKGNTLRPLIEGFDGANGQQPSARPEASRGSCRQPVVMIPPRRMLLWSIAMF